MANTIKLDTASKRYAFALYSLAEKNKKVEEIQSEFSKVVDVLKDFPEWFKISANPAIDSNKKAKSFYQNIGKFNLIKELESFFKVIISREKTPFIPEIYKEFKKIYNANKGIEVIEISSATKILKADKEKLEKFIKKSNSSVKEVEFIEIIDQSLISGFKFMFDSKVYDSSMLNKLEKLKNTLK